jgi:hypothetical protein
MVKFLLRDEVLTKCRELTLEDDGSFMARTAERSSGQYSATMWTGKWKVLSEADNETQVELDIEKVLLQTRVSGETKPRKVIASIQGTLKKPVSATLPSDDDLWEEAVIPLYNGAPIKIM